MANVFKRAANYLGLVDEEEDLAPATVNQEVHRAVRSVPQALRPTFNPIPATNSRSLVEAPSSGYAPVQEQLPIMDQIFTIHPRFYNEARTVGERYRLSQPVLMNLSDMDESERKRLHGSIERVTSKVFLLTPANVRVSTENKTAATEASFFNQS
jgi:cell division inhibitor SepF